MPDKIDQAATALQEFVKSRDVAPIGRAVDALEEFDLWSVAPDQRMEARRSLLLNWSRVLVAIDSIKESGFDPDAEHISMNPEPPSGYPSSVSPASIKDPKIRAQYEAAIAAHDKKKARDRAQLLLIEYDQRAVQSAQRAVERLYTSSAADQKELDAVFAESGLNEARRQEVRRPARKP